VSPVRRRRIYKWELDVDHPGVGAARRFSRRLSDWITPARLFIISFLLAIVVGAIGLASIPPFHTDREPLEPIDALFTSTSAVCVTGLIVVDTATEFTLWGKLWILMLIQIGGLGVITYTTVLIVALGGRPSLKQEGILAGALDAVPSINYRKLATDVVRFTLVIEGLGAVILALLWWPRFGIVEGTGHAIFHAISAFCNAGFSTFGDSLESFHNAPLTLMTVMLMIVVGGIGFLTLEELSLWRPWSKRRKVRLSLHSRIVLGMTLLLIVLGHLTFLVLEWNHTLDGMGPINRFTNALFMSVTSRTAGFNTVPYAQATVGATFVTILLMFIGGAPGSTAGGLKVTTVALPGLLAWSRLRGRNVTWLWHRTIPEETIQRAVGLIVLGFALVTGGILILVITEEVNADRFLAFMFESVSAFDTVGLSLGATTRDLSAAGKITTILLMFLGRVGLPTAASALTVSFQRKIGEIRYAHEDVLVG